jgi:hypothetical protein
MALYLRSLRRHRRGRHVGDHLHRMRIAHRQGSDVDGFVPD